MNKSVEIQAPVEEKSTKQVNKVPEQADQLAKQSATVSKKDELSSSETVVEAENPEQFEKLRRWFDILRRVCQEKPRVVLKALSKPEKLIDYQFDNFIDGDLVKAEPLGWELGGRRRLEKRFRKEDLDHEKAIQVVEYLRSNISNEEYAKDTKHGQATGSLVTITRFYQYKEKDHQDIKNFVKSCDDPTHLLSEIETIVDFSDIGDSLLPDVLEYAKSLANNPRALEIIAQLKEIEDFKKLNIGEGDLCSSGSSKKDGYFWTDPINYLLKLDDNAYQQLFSQENLDYAQELWKKRVGEKPLEIKHLACLLEVADNPNLEIAILARLKKSEGFFEKPKEFREAIKEVEALQELFPEIWELEEDGFDVDSYFQISFLNDSNSLLSDIEKLVAVKEKLVTTLNTEPLRQNARIYKKYGLKLLFPHWDQTLDFGSEAFREPRALEKSLIIANYLSKDWGEFSFHHEKHADIFTYGASEDDLSAFSVEEVKAAFLPLKDKEIIGPKPSLFGIVRNLESIEELKERLATIINPEIRTLIEDNEFLKKVYYDQLIDGPDQNLWDHVLENPDLYIDLYRDQEVFDQKLNILHKNGFNLQGILYPEGLRFLMDMSEDELSQASQALLAEGNRFSQHLDLNNLKKARLLSKLDQTELSQIEADFRSNSSSFKSFYYEQTYMSTDLRAEDLELYLSFDQGQRQEVWKVLDLLSERYDFRREKEIFEKDVIHDLGFLCRLSNNETYLQKFQLLSDHLNSNQESINAASIIGKSQLIFEKILNFLQQNPELTLADCIDEEGVISTKYINDLANKYFKESEGTGFFYGFDEISNLFNDQTLAKMDNSQRIFWQFWQEQDLGYIKQALLKTKEQFDSLSLDEEAAKQWLLDFSQSSKENLNNGADKKEKLVKSKLSSREKQELKGKVLQIISKEYPDSNKFYAVCSVLKHELNENSHLIESFAPAFKEAFGFDLSEDFVKKYDRFFQESQGEDFAALITDHLSYWKNNSNLLAKLELIDWEVNDFNRFRSLVQNHEINNVLSNTNKDLLISLSQDIGLSLNNIYYANKSSLQWLEHNLDSAERKTFFKKILNEKPSGFNSCVSGFKSIDNKIIDQVIAEPLYTERLFSAMKEFNNITPSLITAYILNPSEEARSEYREKLNQFRRDVHRNISLKSLAEGNGGIDFLADMIALTFPGTNFSEIKRELDQLQDRCDDVANLEIREQGYQGQIVSKEKIVQLRDTNKPIDDGVVNLIKVIFADQQEKEYLDLGGDNKLAFQGWARLLVEAGATNQKVLFRDNLSEVIACSRVSLGDKITLFAEKMAGDTSQLPAKSEILSKAQELFGIYYKDNAPEAIELFLQKHQQEADVLLRRLSQKRLNSLEKNIADSKAISEESRANFKEIIEGLRSNELPEAESRQLLARLLAFMTDRSIFSGSVGLRKKVTKENKKIILRDKEGQDVDPNLIISGHVTKNIASYFAKNTAGVCTAGDKELFNRPDHFHVNLVNPEGIIVGNIQAYQTIYNRQPTLIFRGFNPSTSIISSTNAEVLCDQMVDIVKQIATDNNISQILVPEQDSWHPLTNRVGEGVDRYFKNKFFSPENKVDFSFNITKRKQVNTFYRIA